MMNRLKIVALFIGIAASVNLFSQTKADALKDAKITSEATLNMDFDRVLNYTLPSVLEMMGGKDTALQVIKSTFEGMKTQGFVFEKADVVKVSEVVKEQGQFRCVVENFNQMKMSEQRFKSKSYLLGIYNETDKHWWFIEAKQLKNKELANQVLPNFETRLDIPEDDITIEAIEE